MKKNDCMIRLEKKEDHREVENLIRESLIIISFLYKRS